MVLSELAFFTCTIHFVFISNNQDDSSYFLPHFYIAGRYAVYLTTCLQNIEMASSKLIKFIRNVYQKNYNLNLINLLFSAHATTTNITDLSAFGRCPWYFKHFYNLVELHSFFCYIARSTCTTWLTKSIVDIHVLSYLLEKPDIPWNTWFSVRTQQFSCKKHSISNVCDYHCDSYH